MSDETTKSGGAATAIFAAIGIALVAGFAFLLLRAQALPSGVVPVVWDKEACAHCKMHVGEPRFAAQLQLGDGRVLNFDDPGCALKHLAGVPPGEVHGLYFHHHVEDRWIPAAEVGFVPASPTPMGFGLGAVERAAAGAISLDAAKAKVAGGGAHP